MLAFAPCANARGYPLLAAHRLAGDLVAAFDALACPERGGGGCLPAEVIAVRRSREGSAAAGWQWLCTLAPIYISCPHHYMKHAVQHHTASGASASLWPPFSSEL